jgi:serine/threonine-protein kinase
MHQPSHQTARLVYAVGYGTHSQLYMRSLSHIDPQPMPGTEGASNPFFSPDGQWVGFFAYAADRARLKKVSVNGGPVITLCEASASAGAAWDGNDTIVFASRRNGAGGGSWVGSTLYRISADGGNVTPITTPDPTRHESHDWPEILPGGDVVLYSVTDRADFDHGRVVALSLKTGKTHTVIERGYHARYIRTGHLLYAFDTKLMAVPFDLKRQTTVGAPVPVVDGILGNQHRGSAFFTASQSGTLADALAGPSPRRVLTWVGRDGHEEPFDMPPDDYSGVRLSPDGTRIAFALNAKGASSVWTWDIATGRRNRITFGTEVASSPMWTLDGRQLLFWSNHGGGTYNVYRHAADGTGETARVTTSPKPQLPQAMTPDGRRLIVQELTDTGTVLSLVTLADGHEAPLLSSSGDFAGGGRISSDGRWIAYDSDELGLPIQVHVRPFPDTRRADYVVSGGDGAYPVWSRDGRELFFVTRPPHKALMAVSIRPGEAFSADGPRKLMDWPYQNPSYDVSIDGRRFLVVKELPPPNGQAGPESRIVVALNWFNELNRLAPRKEVKVR